MSDQTDDRTVSLRYRDRVASAARCKGHEGAYELVQQCIERIEQLNPKVNAFVTVCADEALAAAKHSG